MQPHSKELRCPVHRDIIAPFLSLQQDAKRAGFDLQLVSGFRDYQRQFKIWSDKISGKRPVLDADERQLDPKQLNAQQLLKAVMRWSALPGASRHHWGTDIDVYDAAAVASDYVLRLTRDETEGAGPFAALHHWLDVHIAEHQAHGFFRPYAQDHGGISPEPWHLSYAPLAWKFQQALKPEVLFAAWNNSQLPLLDQVHQCWSDIWKNYIWIDEALYPVI